MGLRLTDMKEAFVTANDRHHAANASIRRWDLAGGAALVLHPSPRGRSGCIPLAQECAL